MATNQAANKTPDKAANKAANRAASEASNEATNEAVYKTANEAAKPPHGWGSQKWIPPCTPVRMLSMWIITMGLRRNGRTASSKERASKK